MFTIIVKDSEGNLRDEVEVERYLIMADKGEQFTRLFSHDNAVDQLGLIEFAKTLLTGKKGRGE